MTSTTLPNSVHPFRRLWPATLPLLLAGCMLGPDYVKPEVAGDATAQARLPRAPQADVQPATPPRPLWRALHDPLLDQPDRKSVR